eukprot:630074-Ditylum_brightwellii.AAC.1
MSLLSKTLNNQPHHGNEEGDETPEKGFNRDNNGNYDGGGDNHDGDGHVGDSSLSTPPSLRH